MNTNQNFGYNAALAQPYPNTVTQLPNWFDMNAVNSMANEHFIFKDLTPATISDVNKIIDNYLIKLNLPHTDQIIQAAYNSIMPMVDAKLKNANASYQNNVGVLTKAVEEILKKYESAIMLNAKLSQERKKAPRKFYFNASGIGVCFDKHTEIEVGYISIQQVINVEIEKDNSYKYYKYVTYYYKPGASDTIMIPLEDVAGRTLIRHFEHFNAICSSKPIANDFLAWCINSFDNPTYLNIPQTPGMLLGMIEDKIEAAFICNTQSLDRKILEKCSDSFKSKVLTDAVIEPDEITECGKKYLDTPQKKILFAICICGALSNIFHILRNLITQILALSSPNPKCTRQASIYLQLYNKEKEVLSFDSNITKIRYSIKTAYDETVVIKDCYNTDNEKRRAQVINEIQTLNHEAGTQPHLTTLISAHAQYQLPPEQRMNLTLDDEFYTRMTSKEEDKMCYDLSRMVYYIINAFTNNPTKWMRYLQIQIQFLTQKGKGKDLPYMESTASYAAITAVIKLVGRILQIQDMEDGTDDLVFSMFQTETNDVEDCNDAICSEFINVLSTSIQNGSLDIEIYSQDMNYDANKPQVIVKGDLLLFDEATINNIILPQLKLTDNLFHLLNALHENMILSTNKKLRYQTTVYSNGLPDRPAFIAVKGNEIIGKNERQMIEAKKCWEWFADKPLDTSFVPIVTNKLDYKAYQPYTYDKAENYHYLVIGASGSGKTHHLTERIVSLAKQGTKVIVIDASDSFKLSEIEEKLSVGGDETVKDEVQKFIEDHFTFHNVDKDGMPVGIFNLKDINVSKNTLLDIIYTILSAHKKDTGARQRAELRKLIEKCIGKDGFSIIDFHKAIKEGELSDSLSEQFEDLLDQGIDSMLIDTGWREFLASTKDIVVISFAALSSSTGYALVDMLLMSLFYYQRNNSNQNLAIFIDEVQNQNWNKNGPIVQVLREGRKYHMGMNYATQNLSGISKDKLQVMLGAGIKVYHRLDSTTAKVIAKETGRKATELTALKQGECIVDGTLYNYKEQAPLPGIVRGYTYRNFVKPTDNE